MWGFEDLARMARKNRRIAEDLAIYLAISAANWRIRLKKIEIKTSELRILVTRIEIEPANMGVSTRDTDHINGQKDNLKGR